MRNLGFISYFFVLSILCVGVSITFLIDHNEFFDSEKLEIFEGETEAENENKTEYIYSEFDFSKDYLITLQNRNPHNFDDLDFLIKGCFIEVKPPPPERV